MIPHRMIIRTVVAGIFVVFLFAFGGNLKAQDGKSLFSQNCASCHAIDKKLVGPALMGVEDRWPNKKHLYEWIRNNQAFLKTGDPYANKLYNEYNKTAMNLFPQLTDAEIGAILKYISDYKPATPQAAGGTATQPAADSDNTLLFGILTLILAVIAFTLMQVNSNLKKLTDNKEGIESPEPVPFWKNRTYIAFVTILLFLVGGYLTTKGAIGLGRNINYEPKQPIFYSHKVHAGINQINCLYCHSGALDSKYSNVPSVNVCMNCHMAINEYKGEKLYTADGDEVNGTEEIKKLYEYANFTPGQPWDASKAKPIEWTKIHMLPAHVYFNHSQHTRVGKVQCQICHGEINKMDEVKQVSELSMGWCINCHRTTQVQFKDNGFYSIYEKYHQDLKDGKLDSTKGVTVEMIGGTECQKCHY
ncbi:MAG: c-type cytochrome [Sphingobacteriales bacterium]|nr:MAG: c-type cytochrome [Sphingobacteriales bacterium]